MLAWLMYIKKSLEKAIENEKDERKKNAYLEEIKRVQQLINELKYTR